MRWISVSPCAFLYCIEILLTDTPCNHILIKPHDHFVQNLNPFLVPCKGAGFHCGRYHAFPGSASLAGHIHRTVFRRSGKQRRQPQTAVGFAAQQRFRCVDRAFRVSPFGNQQMGWRFTTSFWAEKKQETFFRFPAWCAAVWATGIWL